MKRPLFQRSRSLKNVQNTMKRPTAQRSKSCPSLNIRGLKNIQNTMKRPTAQRSKSCPSLNIRDRVQDHWLSLLPDLCERTLQSVLPDLREYATQLLLRDIEDYRIQYNEYGHPVLSVRSMRNIQRLEKMGMAGCKLAIAANSSKIDFESLGELLVELLPFLWSTTLQDTALETLRAELEERFGEKVEEVRTIAEDLFSGDSDSSSPRSKTSSSPTNNPRRRRFRIPSRWRDTRVASWYH